MLPAEIGYAQADSLAEAIDLSRSSEGARALAGGQTLVSVMKARAASPEALIDLERARRAARASSSAPTAALEIGAMTTYTDIVESAEARARPILGRGLRADRRRAGPEPRHDRRQHLRQRPDEPPAAPDGRARREMTIAGADGERTVSAEDFFLGVYMTAVGPGEILTKITIPPGRRDGFASVTIGRDGTCIVCAAVIARRQPARSRSAASTPCPTAPRRRGRLNGRPARRRSQASARRSTRRATSMRRPTTGGTSPRSSSARAIVQASERRSL